jgi:hypothetical protein
MSCDHGWTREYLEQARAKALADVEACIADSTHPFRREMIAGAERNLASIDAHIAEIGKPSKIGR